MIIPYPLTFELNLHKMIWGGSRLMAFKGLPSSGDDHVGESWEVSAVEGNESVISNGSFKGRTLADLLKEYKEKLVGNTVYKRYGDKFPLLVKFIDAAHDLSIQVHPNDSLSMQRHGKFGKTEMWYVMEAQPDAHLYCGFNTPISKYEYRKRVEDHSITEVLRKYTVEAGNVFFIPAGRVHAICEGPLVAEVQQSSDVTYRIYDYDRMGLDGKPRQLHTELAVDAIDYSVNEMTATPYEREVNKPVYVADCPFFTVKLVEINRPFHRKLYKYDSFVIYMCLEDDCKIEVLSTKGYGWGVMPEVTEIVLKKGNSCLVPASVSDIRLVPLGPEKKTKLLEVYIDNKNYV